MRWMYMKCFFEHFPTDLSVRKQFRHHAELLIGHYHQLLSPPLMSFLISVHWESLYLSKCLYREGHQNLHSSPPTAGMCHIRSLGVLDILENYKTWCSNSDLCVLSLIVRRLNFLTDRVNVNVKSGLKWSPNYLITTWFEHSICWDGYVLVFVPIRTLFVLNSIGVPNHSMV